MSYSMPQSRYLSRFSFPLWMYIHTITWNFMLHNDISFFISQILLSEVSFECSVQFAGYLSYISPMFPTNISKCYLQHNIIKELVTWKIIQVIETVLFSLFPVSPPIFALWLVPNLDFSTYLVNVSSLFSFGWSYHSVQTNKNDRLMGLDKKKKW